MKASMAEMVELCNICEIQYTIKLLKKMGTLKNYYIYPKTLKFGFVWGSASKSWGNAPKSWDNASKSWGKASKR